MAESVKLLLQVQNEGEGETGITITPPPAHILDGEWHVFIEVGGRSRAYPRHVNAIAAFAAELVSALEEVNDD